VGIGRPTAAAASSIAASVSEAPVREVMMMGEAPAFVSRVCLSPKLINKAGFSN